jgi:hypothetical protein
LTVGAGVSWDEREDGDRAAVVVHIYGGNWDADAFLRLAEARNLRTLLDDAIGIVAGVISGPRWPPWTTLSLRTFAMRSTPSWTKFGSSI